MLHFSTAPTLPSTNDVSFSGRHADPLPRRVASQSRNFSPELIAEGVLRKPRARVLLRVAIAVAIAGAAGPGDATPARTRRIAVRTLCR